MLGGLILTFITSLGSAPTCEAPISLTCVLNAATVEAEAIASPSQRVESRLEVTAAALAAKHGELSDRLLADIQRELESLDIDEASLKLHTTLAATLTEAGQPRRALEHIQHVRSNAAHISDETKRGDLLAKLAVAQAEAGDSVQAVDGALSIPESNDSLAAFKARALHDIAPIQGRMLNIETARTTLAKITMGLTYYQAAAAADVAVVAHGEGNADAAAALLDQAYVISMQQSDGYFKAGALRHVADAYAAIGSMQQANAMYRKALVAAESAQQPQQRARAISRIATSMSDQAMFAEARQPIVRAIELALAEPAGLMRWWALYEIAGSAAFAGDFETANRLLLEIPASAQFGKVSLRAVVQRDIAWGLARHGELKQAYELATQIHTAREQIQALSRIILVTINPKMTALPRYL